MIRLGTYTAPHTYNPLQDTRIQPPTPPADVHIYIAVVRHGTRYPTRKVYATFDDDLKNAVPSDEIANLTEKGKAEMRDYGVEVRRTYPHIFTHPERFKVFSTTVRRAEQSAMAFVEGVGMPWLPVETGPAIDRFLKVKDFFIKPKPDPAVAQCQYAHVLRLPTKDDYCLNVAPVAQEYEKYRSRLAYQSAKQNAEKARELYEIILRILQTNPATPQGFVFFAHDSTLMPLYELFNLLPKSANLYANEEWLPFGARLVITRRKI